MSSSLAIPVAGKVLLDREELQGLIDQMRAAIPEDIQHAEEVLRSQEELLSEAREAAQRIRNEAEMLFQQRLDQHELVVAAREHAKAIVAKSEQEAQTILAQGEQELAARRKELDEYSLALLRRLEGTLTGHLTNVRSGIDGIEEGKSQGPGARQYQQ